MIEGTTRSYRFLAARTPSTDYSAFDRPLDKSEHLVVIPTLGSLLPLWVLCIPLRCVQNFAKRDRNQIDDPIALAARYARHFGRRPESTIWFEHGACEAGSTLGCGVDQAHVHLIFDAPFDLDALRTETERLADVSWIRGAARDHYNGAVASSSYLAIGDTTSGDVATNVDFVGSQFLRRAVAALVGSPGKWDYRQYIFEHNILETITALSTEKVSN